MSELLVDEIGPAIDRQRRRYRWTLTGLVVNLLVRGLAALADVWQFWILRQIRQGRAPEVRDVAVLNDVIHRVLGTSQMLALIATGIVFLIWLHGAYRFLQVAGRPSLSVTPNWAVGYWFVPVISVYRPYQVMKELVSRSGVGNPRGPGLPEPSRLPFAVWWTTYLVGNTFGLAILRFQARQTLDDLERVTIALFLTNSLEFVAGACLIAIVNRVQEMQLRLAAASETPVSSAPGTDEGPAVSPPVVGTAPTPEPGGGPATE